MIDPEHKLSISRQSKLLGFSRGSLYYSPCHVSDGDLALIRRIDELHFEYRISVCEKLNVARALKSERWKSGN